MTKRFEFLFDVGGPNGYLVHRVLPKLCEEAGAEAVYVPILLGAVFKATGNRAPMVRYADAPAKRDYEMLEFRRFIAANGLIDFRMNPNFPVNSLLAMRVIVAAERMGVGARCIESLMTAMWEQGAKLDEADVCRAALDAAGLDGAALMALGDDVSVKAELVANTERAVARGVFGIPTFFVGDEMFWGKERLPQLREALAA
ncbi:MAG: 2-hydroxychromene-2-carboxylate isomerase [Sphingomonas sp.]